MAKTRTKGKKMNGGIIKLKVVMERLQKRLLSSMKLFSDGDFEEIRVPDDVKEGHFAVIAEDDDELKRFIVPLSFLTHPSFLMLLEQSAEKYGFDHEGALTVPCRPATLEQILAERLAAERGTRVAVGGGAVVDKWSSFNKNMAVKSH